MEVREGAGSRTSGGGRGWWDERMFGEEGAGLPEVLAPPLCRIWLWAQLWADWWGVSWKMDSRVAAWTQGGVVWSCRWWWGS